MSRLVTFYSYKGGVGRTQALANTAVALANAGKRVVMVDMDLESPGLHTYFYPKIPRRPEDSLRPLTDEDLSQRDGMLDFLLRCAEAPTEEPVITDCLFDCTHPCLTPGKGTLQLLSPGRLDDGYPQRLAAFSWEDFYEHREGAAFMEMIRTQLLRGNVDFVLLDSRTGVTDVATVCTFQLPDIVVILFALHQQGLEGARRTADAIQRRRVALIEDGMTDPRPQRVLLLPSRVENNHLAARDEWFMRTRLHLDMEGVELLIERGQFVPYLPAAAFGEQVVVDPRGEPNDLSAAYQHLAQRLSESPASANEEQLRATQPTLRALRNSWSEVEQEVRALGQEVRAYDPLRTPLRSLPAWSNTLRYRQVRLLHGLREIQRELERLQQEARLPPRHEIPLPVTLEEWESTVVEVSGQLTSVGASWQEAIAKDIAKRLQESAEGDEELLQKYQRELTERLDDVDSASLEQRIVLIQRELQRSSLDGLLRRNALTEEVLRARFPDPSRLDDWLAARLSRVIEIGSLDESGMHPLRNLLRLRSAREVPLSQNDWIGYDLLVLFAREKNSAEVPRSLFVEIGAPLWRRFWEQYFCDQSGVRDPEWPPCTDGRTQLHDLAEDQDPAVRAAYDKIVASVTSGLQKSLDAADLGRLFDKRSNDPCLRRALLQVADGQGEPLRRRLVLASWLHVHGPTQQPQLLVGFLRSLADDGLLTEAFYGLSAFLQMAPEHAEDASHDTIYIGYLITAWQRSRDQVVSLLQQPSLRDRLAKMEHRAGLGLLLYCTTGLCEDQPPDLGIVSWLRAAFAEQFPEPLRRWLQRNSRARSPQITDIKEKSCRFAELIANTNLRGSYAARFEESFRVLVDQLRTTKLQRVQFAHEVLESLDANQWIDQTYKALARENKLIRREAPDAVDRRIMKQRFEQAKDLLVKINALRPEDGSTIAELLQADEDAANAVRSLKDWLIPPDPQVSPHPLARRIADLL